MWTRRMQFWQNHRKFLNKKPKILQLLSKNADENFIFKRETYILILVRTRRKQFSQRRHQVFIRRPIFFCSMTEFDSKIRFSQKNICFVKKVRWRRRMQFWQPYRNCCGGRSKKICSIPEEDRQIVKKSKKPIFYKMFPWKRQLELSQPSQINYSTKGGIFLFKVPEPF